MYCLSSIICCVVFSYILAQRRCRVLYTVLSPWCFRATQQLILLCHSDTKLSGIKWHSFCTFGLICSHAVQCLLLHCFVMTTGHIFIEEQALVPEAHFCCWPSFSSQSCLRRQTYFQPIIQLHIFEQKIIDWHWVGRGVKWTSIIWAGYHFSTIKAPDFESAVSQLYPSCFKHLLWRASITFQWLYWYMQPMIKSEQIYV